MEKGTIKESGYGSQEQLFNNWLRKAKKGKIKGINKNNLKLLVECLNDFNLGLNTSKLAKKGSRSKIRLNHLQQKILFIMRRLEERGIKDITKTKAEDLHKLLKDMREGILKTSKGRIYKSAGDYIKDFKTFWHWYMKVEKKKGKLIEDITEDLDSRGEKPKFVYFTQEDLNRMIEKAEHDLKIVMLLAFDTGARCKELINLKVSDISDNFSKIEIREETAKTFGRKINLILCSSQLKDYIKKLDLKNDDFIIQSAPGMINRFLKEIGRKILTKEQIKFKNLSIYDFRHSSACFWVVRYKNESALKYRFGWKKSDMIHYYTEFLGMKDTITQDDLYIDITKTELEKELTKIKTEYTQFKEETKQSFTELRKAFAELTNPINEVRKSYALLKSKVHEKK